MPSDLNVINVLISSKSLNSAVIAPGTTGATLVAREVAVFNIFNAFTVVTAPFIIGVSNCKDVSTIFMYFEVFSISVPKLLRICNARFRISGEGHKAGVIGLAVSIPSIPNCEASDRIVVVAFGIV